MANVTEALIPAFVAGFAIQQVLERADNVLSSFDRFRQHKTGLLGVLALGAGLTLAPLADIRMLLPLGTAGHPAADYIVTGFFISGGTTGFNSLLKFLDYAKVAKKSDAATKKQAADGALRLADRHSQDLAHAHTTTAP